MTYYKDIESYKSLSIQKIKERVSSFKLREEQHIITFSKNFTISLSNYCQNQCGYCFYNYKIPKLGGKGNVVLIENDDYIALGLKEEKDRREYTGGVAKKSVTMESARLIPSALSRFLQLKMLFIRG